MPTPTFFSFRTVLENKVAAYLTPLFPGVTVNKGVTDEIRVIPMIIAHAESSQSVPDLGSQTLGNYTATLKLSSTRPPTTRPLSPTGRGWSRSSVPCAM